MKLVNPLLMLGVLVVSPVMLLGHAPTSAQTRQEIVQEFSSDSAIAQKPAAPIVAPPVENLQTPAATVSLPDGRVEIILVNQTGTQVVYQVLGQPNQANLAADATNRLDRLSTPANLSFYRPDRGSIEVTAQAIGPGQLRVIFKRGANLDIDRLSLTVQETGQVFLN